MFLLSLSFVGCSFCSICVDMVIDEIIRLMNTAKSDGEIVVEEKKGRKLKFDAHFLGMMK